MSITIMSAVWKMPIQAGRKLVLLALADMGNDEGVCWPSVESLCGRTGFSARAVQGHLRDLEKAGNLVRHERYKSSTVYTVIIDAAQILHPTDSGAQKTAAGAQNLVSLGRRICHSGAQNLHPDPSIDPSIESSLDPSIPDWVPKDAWHGFVEMRKQTRAKLTARGIQRTIADLTGLKDAGEDPGAVLWQSVQRSWRGVFPVRQQQKGFGDHNRAELQKFLNKKAALNG